MGVAKKYHTTQHSWLRVRVKYLKSYTTPANDASEAIHLKILASGSDAAYIFLPLKTVAMLSDKIGTLTPIPLNKYDQAAIPTATANNSSNAIECVMSAYHWLTVFLKK